MECLAAAYNSAVAIMNHLEDSNDWTPNDLRWAEFTEDLQRFEQCMHHFFLLYTPAMRQLPSDNVVPVAAHLDYTVVHELRKTFLVTVHYLRYHLRRDELPLRPFRLSKKYSRLLDHEHVTMARMWMSRVLLRKQCRRRGVRLPLDASGHPYRSAHHMGRDALSSALNISTKWIVGWAIIMPLELQTLLITYSFVIQHMPNLDDAVGAVKDLPIRVRIENFTTPCTDEAMNSEDPECEVCGFSFGHTHSVEEATEPAVKTSCNHIIGASCLQTWV
jgi:hypothetical protein